VAEAIGRREFMARSAMLTGAASLSSGALGSVLAACGGNDASTGEEGSFGSVSYQLSWLKNIQFAGSYVADDRGYYQREGFSSVQLLAGGPNITIEPKVVSRRVFVGNSQPDFTAAASTKGAPVKIIGAQYQKSPWALMSMASTPIKTPQEMVGKKIGSPPTNTVVWESFLKLNKIDPKQLTTVPIQHDPLPLTTGEVDGWLSFAIDEPNILRAKGFDVFVFLFDDFNYVNFAQVYVVRPETLRGEDREKAKGFLKAEVQGWKFAIANGAQAARLAVNVAGKDLGLDLKEQTLSIREQNNLMVTDSTKENGLFFMDDVGIEGAIRTMEASGIQGIQKSLFTNEILEEVYEEDANLRTL
jgi:ABC-type nitrate/sulfonate/bicarbonate transport system substrate-binding protein